MKSNKSEKNPKTPVYNVSIPPAPPITYPMQSRCPSNVMNSNILGVGSQGVMMLFGRESPGASQFTQDD
ncbi:hypothetical protein VTJ04DRAFT_4971 [Mycothermus thermophilus]|uniref:uncharacterized protein n=1 Tax=Humicola insolens TaxID=85995 RepID=UPI003743DBBB